MDEYTTMVIKKRTKERLKHLMTTDFKNCNYPDDVIDDLIDEHNANMIEGAYAD